MTTLQKDALLQKRGQDLYDREGEKIGTIEEIYLDAQTAEPEWALVNTGMFGTKSSFVPLQEAAEDGNTLRVPYHKSQVKDAPRMNPDGELSQDDESTLYAHYGISTASRGRTPGCPRAAPAQVSARARPARARPPRAAMRASAARLRSAMTPPGASPTTP